MSNATATAAATATAHDVLQDLTDLVADLLAAHTGHDRVDYESSEEASTITGRHDEQYVITADTVDEVAQRIAHDLATSLAADLETAETEQAGEAEFARENGRAYEAEEVVAMLLVNALDDIDLEEPMPADGVRVYVSAWA